MNGDLFIDTYAFSGSAITSLALPEGLNFLGRNQATEGSMHGYAFYNCTALVSVSVPASLSMIDSNTFRDCRSLVSVTFADAAPGAGSVKFLSYCFQDCTALERVTLPARGVVITATSGLNVFAGCISLKTINLEVVTNLLGDNAFQGCASLTSADLSGAGKLISTAPFDNCSSLRSVTLAPTITTMPGFKNCPSLDVYVPASVTTISGAAFRGVKSVTVDPGNVNFTVLAGSGVVVNSSKALVCGFARGDLDLSGYGSEITSIGSYAFSGNTYLTSIILPDSITTISVANTFTNCTALETVSLPGVTKITGGNAFYGCTALTSVSLPALDTISGGNAFNNCTALTTVSIGTEVTSLAANTFGGCTALTSVTILAASPPTVTATTFPGTAAGLVIYVPSDKVEAYKSASIWSANYASRIQAIPAA
jgi:hypothetical protein